MPRKGLKEAKQAWKRKSKTKQIQIQIDWKQVDSLGRSGASGCQIAARIGVVPGTLYERCLQEHSMPWSAYLAQLRASGDAVIHVAQYQKAVADKNSTMLIWLGKQRLGQRDNPDEEQTKADATADAIKSLSDLTISLTPDIVSALSALSPEDQLKLVQTVMREGKSAAQSEEAAEFVTE